MTINSVLLTMKGGLIVSCQPDADHPELDPMNLPEIMAALAQSAVLGGAVAIRADGPAHIAAIRAAVDVPIIGILKHDLEPYPVRITPTVEDALAVAQAGADFIAIDATDRPRPQGSSAAEFLRQVIAATDLPVMADIATFDEGVQAAQVGACAVLTTLSGYTSGSPKQDTPDFDLIIRLSGAVPVPVIAEGRIYTPEQAARALHCGAWAVTVGSAITRPRATTQRFVKGLSR